MAWVGTLASLEGQRCNVVVVDASGNPKGAVLVVPQGTDGEVSTAPFDKSLAQVHAANAIDVLCMQERAFGEAGLPPLPEPPADS